MAQAIVTSVLESLGPSDRVVTLQLEVGALSGVVGEALHFGFELATRGTPLEGCRLDVRDVPISLHCHPCGRTFQPEQLGRLVCPACQTPSADLRTGRELMIVSMEVTCS